MTVAAKRNRRREAIINAARQVFFESGYTAASMSSIAAHLGGAKGTLYNYCGNKEELFEALVRDFSVLGPTRFRPSRTTSVTVSARISGQCELRIRALKG
jgi:AcrR family transcriptional regulator